MHYVLNIYFRYLKYLEKYVKSEGGCKYMFRTSLKKNNVKYHRLHKYQYKLCRLRERSQRFSFITPTIDYFKRTILPLVILQIQLTLSIITLPLFSFKKPVYVTQKFLQSFHHAMAIAQRNSKFAKQKKKEEVDRKRTLLRMSSSPQDFPVLSRTG